MCAVTSAEGGSMTAPKSQNGSLSTSVAGVVGVEGAPAAVLGLHPGQPGQRAVDGGLVLRRASGPPGAGRAPPRRCRRCRGSCRCRTRTPSRRGPGPACGPTSRPGRGSPRRAPTGRRGPGTGHRRPGPRRPARSSSSTVSQTGDWHASRRRTGPSGCLSRMVNRSRPAMPLAMTGWSSGVAEQVQRHQRVHPGRLDAAPAAVLLLPGDDPLGARRSAARRTDFTGR